MPAQSPSGLKRKLIKAGLMAWACSVAFGASLGSAHAVPRNPCVANEHFGLYHPTQGAVIATFGLHINPVTGEKVFHPGIDYFVQAGDAVMAAGLGRVKALKQDGPDDLQVVIDHGRGLEVIYSHLAQTALIPGRCLNATDVLGRVGSRHPVEGGQKLRVQVRKNGNLVDPLSVFQQRGFRALRR